MGQFYLFFLSHENSQKGIVTYLVPQNGGYILQDQSQNPKFLGLEGMKWPQYVCG